ncbi:MAG: ornithine cyclodeaminase family protein [Betaproteobacteria bacterium]
MPCKIRHEAIWMRIVNTFLYLCDADIAALGLAPDVARAAVVAAFRAHHQGRTVSRPKQSLDLGPGHAFQSLCSAWKDEGLAANKWLGMAPVAAGSGARGIHALIMLNDYESGRLLAILDGNLITALRTAAMSAAAAQFLASSESRSIGFIGCGLQARFHLSAMAAVLPKLRDVRAFSRTRRSADAFIATAAEEGFRGTICADAESVVRRSDVIVTSVPMKEGFEPFLDPGWIANGAFVAAVDVARSWRPQALRALDILAIDDHAQQHESPPIAAALGPRGSFDADLAELAAGVKPGRTDAAERAMFIFRGFALADLAVAAKVFAAATDKSIGHRLPH